MSQSKKEWREMYIHGALKLYKGITDHPAICTESNYSKVYIISNIFNLLQTNESLQLSILTKIIALSLGHRCIIIDYVTTTYQGRWPSDKLIM